MASNWPQNQICSDHLKTTNKQIFVVFSYLLNNEKDPQLINNQEKGRNLAFC